MATTTRVRAARTVTGARWSASVLSALIVSQLGLALALVTLGLWALFVQDTGFWHALRAIASYRFGEGAMTELGPYGYVWGAAFASGVAALWGLAYGLLAAPLRVDENRFAPVLLGLVVGLVAHQVNVERITPAVMGALHGRDLWALHVPPVASWLAYLAFGLSFAAWAPLFRRLALGFSKTGGRAGDPRIR